MQLLRTYADIPADAVSALVPWELSVADEADGVRAADGRGAAVGAAAGSGADVPAAGAVLVEDSGSTRGRTQPHALLVRRPGGAEAPLVLASFAPTGLVLESTTGRS